MTTRQPVRRVELGPTGNAVADNVARFRKGQGLTLRQVADRMAEVGRPITHTAVSDIENRARRVDSDDLVALALVLGVAPSSLLMPHTTPSATGSATQVEVTGAGERSARDVWDWLRTDAALDPALDPREFRFRAVPAWADELAALGMDARGKERRRGNR